MFCMVKTRDTSGKASWQRGMKIDKALVWLLPWRLWFWCYEWNWLQEQINNAHKHWKRDYVLAIVGWSKQRDKSGPFSKARHPTHQRRFLQLSKVVPRVHIRAEVSNSYLMHDSPLQGLILLVGALWAPLSYRTCSNVPSSHDDRHPVLRSIQTVQGWDEID